MRQADELLERAAVRIMRALRRAHVMTTIPPIPILESVRVRLRPFTDADIDPLFAIYSDGEVMRYWSSTPWTSRDQAVEHVARLRREREIAEFYPWAAALRSDDSLIGTCTLFDMNNAHGRSAIGYALNKSHWGQGYASEMLALALEHAFGPLARERIEADIDPRNSASCRLVERFGFSREGTLRERWRVGGELQDSAMYGLLRREYEARGQQNASD